MKKALIITLSLTAAILMSACSKATVEKQPVEIPDTNQLSINDVNTKEESKPQPSPTGTAAISEEKASLKISREGTEETIPGTLFKSSIGYEIIYAEDFKRTIGKEVDCFTTDNSDLALYPDIYVNVRKVYGVSSVDYADNLSKKLEQSSNYKSIETTNEETIGNNYKAIKITALAGTEWNSVIRNYYITEVSDTVYFIETQYYVEAEEGYGSIIKAMLNTFNVQK